MPGPDWDRLHASTSSFMAIRLGDSFKGFSEAWERIGLLHENFVKVDEFVRNEFASYDAAYVCSMYAAAVVSAANHYGGHDDCETATRLARWALLLEPECIPALLCLQTCATRENDEKTAQSYIQQARMVYEKLQVRPRESLSAYQQGLVDSGRQAFGA